MKYECNIKQNHSVLTTVLSYIYTCTYIGENSTIANPVRD